MTNNNASAWLSNIPQPNYRKLHFYWLIRKDDLLMHNIYILRGNNAELFDFGIYGVFDSNQKALDAAQQLINKLIDNGDRDLLRDEGQVYQVYRDDKLYAGLEIVKTTAINRLWTADLYGDQGTSINVDPKTFQIVD